jgi:hypothetical protein
MTELTMSIERSMGQYRQYPLGMRRFGISSVRAFASQMNAGARVMMWAALRDEHSESEAWNRGKQESA